MIARIIGRGRVRAHGSLGGSGVVGLPASGVLHATKDPITKAS